MGIINVIKTMSQSVGPLVTGLLASKGMFGVSFIIAGVLKAVYDLGVLAVFTGHKSQEKEVEPEAELELKLTVLEMFNERYDRRVMAKDFIFDRGLMNYRTVSPLCLIIFCVLHCADSSLCAAAREQ